MKWSWAGAMGQLQFMPSTFIGYAKDGDGDGRKNIWGSAADALESAGNFMSSKWRPGLRWGRQAQVPERFDISGVDDAVRHTAGLRRRQRPANRVRPPVVGRLRPALRNGVYRCRHKDVVAHERERITNGSRASRGHWPVLWALFAKKQRARRGVARHPVTEQAQGSGEEVQAHPDLEHFSQRGDGDTAEQEHAERERDEEWSDPRLLFHVAPEGDSIEADQLPAHPCAGTAARDLFDEIADEGFPDAVGGCPVQEPERKPGAGHGHPS
jgi:hypothetical protein